MKIFPVKFLSPLDRAKTLMKVMSDSAAGIGETGGTKRPTLSSFSKQADVTGGKFFPEGLRSIYRNDPK